MFQEMIDKIVAGLDNPLWWISQAFAAVALVAFLWGWSIKNKIKMMILIGIASAALAISASFLTNFSLGFLFGLAAVRNFVFAYLDTQAKKGKVVKKQTQYIWAGIFAVSTIAVTILFLTIWDMYIYYWWLETFICVTLLGLIVGNILTGTNLMRISFMANRAFNIVNHILFANLISIIIAALAIGSNIIYYIRMWAEKIKSRGETGLARKYRFPASR